MKLLKLLFSKIFISALALLIQLAFFVIVILFYETYFTLFQAISLAFGILIFLNLINKKESCEFTLPWIVIILIVPFYGTLIYCMFANSKMPTRQYKIMVSNVCRCKPFFEMTPEENRKILDFTAECAGLEHYLRKN